MDLGSAHVALHRGSDAREAVGGAYSLAHTALAHGSNPRAYLHAVVAKLIAGHLHTRLDDLLPPDAMLRARSPELADPLRSKAEEPRIEAAREAA